MQHPKISILTTFALQEGPYYLHPYGDDDSINYNGGNVVATKNFVLNQKHMAIIEWVSFPWLLLLIVFFFRCCCHFFAVVRLHYALNHPHNQPTQQQNV
jgi:hypothetical protein